MKRSVLIKDELSLNDVGLSYTLLNISFVFK